jgi:hypothetical protein
MLCLKYALWDAWLKEIVVIIFISSNSADGDIKLSSGKGGTGVVSSSADDDESLMAASRRGVNGVHSNKEATLNSW